MMICTKTFVTIYSVDHQPLLEEDTEEDAYGADGHANEFFLILPVRHIARKREHFKA